jgi:hypothetical protein
VTAESLYARALARLTGRRKAEARPVASPPADVRITPYPATDPRYMCVKSVVDEETFICPRPLPQDLLRNCVVLADRFELLRKLPGGGVVAEVGTDYGDFAKKIVEESRPRHLHIFDLSFRRFDRGYFSQLIESNVVILHEGDSSTKLAEFPDLMFDWIYIDGDHSFEGVKKDIDQAITKIKQDGFVVFNDYTIHSPLERMQYGVMRAVNDLCLDHGFEVAYLALSTLGYHDVALRRR